MASFELGPASPFPLYFMKMLFTSQPQAPSSLNLTGQTGIITGGYTGLGYACAEALLTHKLSHLIITVRDEKKGNAAAATLRKQYPTATIEVWLLDMLSYDSIQAFVKRTQDLQRIDFVILNAGVATGSFRLSESTNHEETFQVNYLSTVLLTFLLLPILKEKHAPGKPARITMVGTGTAQTAHFAEINETPLFAAFNNPKYWAIPERYNTAKLLLLMFIHKLRAYVAAEDVVVNVADPGLVKNSGMDRHAPAFLKLTFTIMRALFARSVPAGAWTLADAAVVKPDSTHGSWICHYGVYAFPKVMHTADGKKATEKVWEETIAELEWADVRGILASMKKS
ncbi:hypothetical protein BJX99DRAFT_250590 [Aspergillus californicus]